MSTELNRAIEQLRRSLECVREYKALVRHASPDVDGAVYLAGKLAGLAHAEKLVALAMADIVNALGGAQ